MSDLFVGITAWNSGTLLPHCLNAVRERSPAGTRIVVFDNCSDDDTVQISRRHQVEVITERLNQPSALNSLLERSDRQHTLLIHADVILLSDRWYEICSSNLTDNVALVSPEDIGCGPYTRPFGKNMPESSFMLFDTEKARRARTSMPKVMLSLLRGRLRLRRRVPMLDLYGPHVTHRLPDALAESGYTWRRMQVIPSPKVDTPLYTPPFDPKYWRDEFAFYRYGLGNFYGLAGEFTHYHNWFDRLNIDVNDINLRSTTTVPKDDGFPVTFLQICTRRFLEEYVSGALEMPDASSLAGYERAALATWECRGVTSRRGQAS